MWPRVFGNPARSLGNPSGATVSYAAYIASLAPVLWYKFNETSGTTVINYGSAPSSNAAWTAGAGALGQTGQLGANNAYDLDGLASIAQVTNNAAWNALQDFTFCALVKADSNGEGNVGTMYAYGTGNQHEFRLTAGMGLLANVLYSGGQINAITTTTINTGVWYWLMMLMPSTTKQIRVFITPPGGTLTEAAYSGQGIGSGTITTRVDDLFLGNRSGASRTWDGLIDEEILFGTALTTTQLQDIVTKGQ